MANPHKTPMKTLIGELRNIKPLLESRKGIAQDEELFECMLKTWRRLQYLEFGWTCLKQKQLDPMPSDLQNLQTLVFRDDFRLGDFQFVAKLKNLTSVWIQYPKRDDELPQESQPSAGFPIRTLGQTKGFDLWAATGNHLQRSVGLPGKLDSHTVLLRSLPRFSLYTMRKLSFFIAILPFSSNESKRPCFFHFSIILLKRAFLHL